MGWGGEVPRAFSACHAYIGGHRRSPGSRAHLSSSLLGDAPLLDRPQRYSLSAPLVEPERPGVAVVGRSVRRFLVVKAQRIPLADLEVWLRDIRLRRPDVRIGLLANLLPEEFNWVASSELLEALARQLRDTYAQAKPFPHVVIDNFLPEEFLDRVLDEFPSPRQIDWIRYEAPRERKLESKDETQLGAWTRHLLSQFNSSTFLQPVCHF